MEKFVLFLFLLLIFAIILYPYLKEHNLLPSFHVRHHNISPCTGPCKTTFKPHSHTTSVNGVCFPGTTFPVKGGLIDLRNCTDEVYILGDKRKVNFITIS